MKKNKTGQHKIDSILFPASFWDRKQVDDAFTAEYKAACATGFYRVYLFDYDEWLQHKTLKLWPKAETEVWAVYRGWMMQPEQYALLFQALEARQIRLAIKPEMYEAMHVFPNVYPAVREDTAKILTFPLHTPIPLEKIRKHFRRFMIKDFVKSVKGTEFPSVFDDSLTQEELDQWMDVFYRYRGELLTGGICVKEYLPLKRYDGKTNEYRVFYGNGEIISVSRNSLQRNFTPEVPMELVRKYQNLDSVFYTVDYAELEDGTWKIIEAGDGSVSGLSDGQDPVAFYRALYCCFDDC